MCSLISIFFLCSVLSPCCVEPFVSMYVCMLVCVCACLCVRVCPCVRECVLEVVVLIGKHRSGIIKGISLQIEQTLSNSILRDNTEGLAMNTDQERRRESVKEHINHL